MADIKLFRVIDDRVAEIPGNSVAIEKSLQTLIEQHLETFLGIRFLASEFVTTKSHGGRIDTLGIDETNCPVIVEYKRALNQNVINQGLFYLNWLMDHRADFKLLVMDKLGPEAGNQIEWRYPRLVCVAGDFTKYDIHAIEQIPQNIDLIRYRRYGHDLMLLEQIASRSTLPDSDSGKPGWKKDGPEGAGSTGKTSDVIDHLQKCSAEIRDWYHSLRAFILGLGDDIDERALPQYIAFRRLKTFAYFHFRPTVNRIAIDVPVSPSAVPIEKDFTKPMRGKYVRILVDSAQDVERAQPIIATAYEKC